jgi:hypothetical protein
LIVLFGQPQERDVRRYFGGVAEVGSSYTSYLKMRRTLEMAGWLQEMIEVAGSMDDAMYLNLLATDDVENEVGLKDQDAITILSKLRMAWYSS